MEQWQRGYLKMDYFTSNKSPVYTLNVKTIRHRRVRWWECRFGSEGSESYHPLASPWSHKTSCLLYICAAFVVTCSKTTNAAVNTSEPPEGLDLQDPSTQTDLIPLRAELLPSDGKRMSVSGSIAVITLYICNYQLPPRERGKKHTSRVIHRMLLTAAARYLKPLFSSALMGVEMSFGLLKEAESRPNHIIQRWWGSSRRVKSLQLLGFLPVVAPEYEWALNMNEMPSSPTSTSEDLSLYSRLSSMYSILWSYTNMYMCTVKYNWATELFSILG